MSGVVEGKSLEESVDRGQWLAALGLKELGPSYVFPFVPHFTYFCLNIAARHLPDSSIKRRQCVFVLDTFADRYFL